MAEENDEARETKTNPKWKSARMVAGEEAHAGTREESPLFDQSLGRVNECLSVKVFGLKPISPLSHSFKSQEKSAQQNVTAEPPAMTTLIPSATSGRPLETIPRRNLRWDGQLFGASKIKTLKSSSMRWQHQANPAEDEVPSSF